MTGESLPVDKSIGDEVFCGTVNRFGTVDIRATQVGEDSSLQRLIRMVRDAENKKAPMARIADKVASWLVPAALLIAIIAWIIVVRAVTVLVVFCPCALVLATPTAIMAAIGQATKHGVIIKSGEALEKMGKVNTVAFDKTGTLTYGKLEVCNVRSFSKEIDENELLSIAASAEAKSEHPLGKAIVTSARELDLPVIESTSFKMTVGKGVYAEINGQKTLCGNETFLSENGVAVENSVNSVLNEFRNIGKATILVSKDGKCIGVLAMSDVLRTESKEMVERLHRMGTDIVLLTGDNQKTADYFATQVGINNVYARLLPEQKVTGIADIQKSGKTVCMIGDGVNDAPALKTADVGIAMGGLGSDVAVEAADIVLMRDDISKLPYLKRLSCATVKTIKASINGHCDHLILVSSQVGAVDKVFWLVIPCS